MRAPTTGGTSATRRTRVAPYLWSIAALGLWGCPPSGDPPPFMPVSEAGVAGDPCVDFDDDGYVEGTDCELPAGDCAPEDHDRNPGAPEVCNRLDDDCDRATDEGGPGSGVACETDQLGICSAGRTACAQGEIVCEPVERPQLREACNGADDDCDGAVDEDNPGGGDSCDTGQPGVCGRGSEQCVGGEVRCVPDMAGQAETCNGEDDDCDGATDEENPEGGGACDTGLDGVCAAGVEACSGGGLTCMATIEASAEICDGLDNDCDGRTDEAFPELGDACTVGEGACARESVFVCAPDHLGIECDAAAGNGLDELCNGEDDDCDGEVDETFPDLGADCEGGQGVCARPGTTVCSADGAATACDAEPGPPAGDETCDGRDEDCDGEIDEAFPTLGDVCQEQIGRCPVRGVVECADGGADVRCATDGPRDPEPELCNAFDDDCDGEVDEDFPTLGAPCVGGFGVCARPGTTICAPDGGLGCDAEPGPPAGDEACNGEDDDCDGFVDEGVECPGPATGVISAIRVAEFDEARCRDVDGDGAADNALGTLAGLFNQRLGGAFADGARGALVRIPAFAPGAVVVELVEGRPTDDGVVAAPRAIDAAGAGLHRVSGVQLADDALQTPNPVGAVRVVSPLFFSEREAPVYDAASFLDLASPALAGEARINADRGLTLRDVTLTGSVDRAALLAAYEAAADACAADPTPPADCAVFALVPPNVVAANLEADLDLDGAGGPESVSVCLVISTQPGSAPPLGGQPCALDDNCPLGLVCRAAPVTEDPALGAALAPRCGPPGIGDAAPGAACAVDADCRNSLCLATTAAGPRCTRLCADAAVCGEDEACRGVAVDLPGALRAGGHTAPVCVPFAGSGAECTAACGGGEVCGVWFAGGIGQPGAAVRAEGRCETPHPDGAALGEACADAFDCAHGNGCVTDLEGGLRCAAPCAAPADCAAGTVCVPTEILAAAGPDPAIAAGVCLPVPPAVGSGTPCAADLACAGGETCRALALPGGAVERFCALGDGFFTVGQPCALDGDCASGRCNGGFCGGLCAENADCQPRLACAADALLSPEGVVLGGDCQPAVADCRIDRDCRDAVACAGGRCVCDGGACRIGCRHPGACPGELYCQADDTCAPFCRDDAAEPDDTPDAAGDLGLTLAGVERLGTLCGTSGMDWYSLSAPGFPFSVEARITGGDEGALLELVLADAFGTPVGDSEVVAGDGGLIHRATLSDPQLARDLAGERMLVRVRGSGIEAEVRYHLDVLVDGPDCPDVDPEAGDVSWEAMELLTDPVRNPRTTVRAWTCPQDEDWYAVFLHNGDELTLELEPEGNEGAGLPSDIELTLIGPDHTRLPSARVRETIPPGEAFGQIIFTPPAMNCSPATSFCTLADGTQTAIFCAGQDALCPGAPWFVRIRGAGPLNMSRYRFDARIRRAQDLQCVPDLHEQDTIFDGQRILASLPPEFEDAIPLPNFREPILTLPIGRTATLAGRACGADGPANVSVEDDTVQLAMLAGESMAIQITQDVPETLVYRSYRLDLATLRFVDVDAEVIAGAVFETTFEAGEDNIYGFRILRGGNALPGAPYDYSLPYQWSFRRLPAGFEPDAACEAPERVPLLGGRATVRGSTRAAEDDHQPLLCRGGLGPDRVYAIRPPAGPGTLVATVRATAEDGYDPAVSIRTDCDTANSEIACNEDDAAADDPLRRARAEAQLNGGRDLFVIVDSFDADTGGAYELSLEWQAD